MVDAGPQWYCDLAPGHPVHEFYHDHEYGAPVTDDRVLFERLILEIMQAGLSWETILKRRSGMAEAFGGYDIAAIAAYGDADTARLLADVRIIRNRRKVAAIIENAQRILVLQREYGSFAAWLAKNHPRTKDSWVKLFRQTFVFTGGEIVGEFLMSIGYLAGAHRPDCPAYATMAALSPPWMTAEEGGEP